MEIESSSNTAYGLLLTFDGYGAEGVLCSDEILLRKVLLELPSLIGMRSLGTPQIVRVDAPDIAGLSGFTFIMESHISIHTYSERGFVTADIYSCKNFDTEFAKKYLMEAFAIADVEVNTLPRGLRFNNPTSWHKS